MAKINYASFTQFGRPIHSIYCKTVLDPLARLLSIPLINFTHVKPYQVTVVSLVLAMVSAFLFLKEQILFAALLFQASVILDFVDGYIARIKRNGSLAGILFDGYSDIFRVVLNISAIAWINIETPSIIILLLVFSSLHFAESFLDFEFIFAEKFLKNNPPLQLSSMEKRVLKLKTFLEKKGLKTILLHYQERLFIVLFLAPITGHYMLFLILAIGVTLFSIHFKLILDTSLLKNKLLNSSSEYLRHK